MKLDPRLKEWATETQARYLDAVNEHGGYRGAGRALGIADTTVKRSMDALMSRAALKGYSSGLAGMDGQLSSVEVLKGRSIYYDPASGKADKVWIKTDVDLEKRIAIAKQAFEAMAEDLPRVKKTLAPTAFESHLCNVYTLTDSHVGALCWGKETQSGDWDLKIAEDVLTGCFERMVLSAPRARVGVVAQLGDFLHQDNMNALTPTSGHLLDADGRFTKVVQVAVRILRRVVDIALQRHERVVVLLAEGNHDISSSIWLRVMFAALYENEPRVEVIDSPLPYYVYRHGETMICWHHGHLKKNNDLPLLFAAQFPQEWGATTKRYVHCGHRHHVEEKEHSGMKVVQHATLAARDAYAARGGWVAEREAKAITYHAKYGEVGRITVTPEMLAAQ